MERVEFSHYNVERRKEWAIFGLQILELILST